MFETLKKQGFSGFKTIAELNQNDTCIPNRMGVYLVLRESLDTPKFLSEGTGGHFKGKDPNVPISELQNNWVAGENIVYIGKAGSSTSSTNLKKRLRQLVSFGYGNPVGHWGGRYLWQLEDAKNLIVCWMTLDNIEPEKLESQLIAEFKEQHAGMRPFANLKD